VIPIANIIALVMIIRETDREIRFESEKELLNQRRQEQQVCNTKYPILLVHGVFFRDFKYFGYWGRIPGQLKRNGATVYFGNQPSADSIADCARILTQRIKQITKDTGCEKVNIIAHSKGGLDCRYAMAFCGAAPYVASLTTISTPHRGSPFADYMLTKVSPKNQKRFCFAYNKTLNSLGEPEADLMTAVRELTTEHCIALDKRMPQPKGVLCQSFGSKMNKPLKGRFPMNFTGVVMGFITQDNDGLVSADSFPWGDDYTLLTSDSPVGISHCDMTDLNRTNLPDFDVREFYVQLVADLKEKGL
jgi:triacylglycerol lipase